MSLTDLATRNAKPKDKRYKLAIWYERNAAKTHMQWEKRQRHRHTLEKYLALFWFGEMLNGRRNDFTH